MASIIGGSHHTKTTTSIPAAAASTTETYFANGAWERTTSDYFGPPLTAAGIPAI
jgi:hypothetical protein